MLFITFKLNYLNSLIVDLTSIADDTTSRRLFQCLISHLAPRNLDINSLLLEQGLQLEDVSQQYAYDQLIPSCDLNRNSQMGEEAHGA